MAIKSELQKAYARERLRTGYKNLSAEMKAKVLARPAVLRAIESEIANTRDQRAADRLLKEVNDERAKVNKALGLEKGAALKPLPAPTPRRPRAAAKAKAKTKAKAPEQTEQPAAETPAEPATTPAPLVLVNEYEGLSTANDRRSLATEVADFIELVQVLDKPQGPEGKNGHGWRFEGASYTPAGLSKVLGKKISQVFEEARAAGAWKTKDSNFRVRVKLEIYRNDEEDFDIFFDLDLFS